MWATAPALVLLVVTACGQPAPTAAVTHSPHPSGSAVTLVPGPPSPSPTPSPTAVAPGPAAGVLVNYAADRSSYGVTLVGLDGKILAAAQAEHPFRATCGGQAAAVTPDPPLSTSNSRLYYLDGAGTVRFLSTDGSRGQAAVVPGSSTVSVAFAVSPDDRRIAVSLTDYTSSPISVRLYVEDLGGGGHREIFTDSSSSGRTVWPVGWYGGRLVVAAYGSSCTQGGGPGVGRPRSYHLVDADTAIRLATIGDESTGFMTDISAGGGTQVTADAIRIYGFGGVVLRSLPVGDQIFFAAAAPSGARLLYCCNSKNQFVITDGNGTLVAVMSAPPGEAGWLDAGHILAGGTGQSQATIWSLSGPITPVPAQGSFAGRIPGGLDAGRGT